MQRQSALILTICLMLVMPTSMAKQTVGWVERAQIYPGEVVLKARIDSGAKTSSLHCDCAAPVMQGGKQGLSFTVRDYQGNKVRFKKKVERIAKVKRHFGERQARYVVRLGICLGTTYKEVDVSLVDRSGMNYPLLIGREFLKDSHVIDPALTYITKPACRVEK